MLRYLWLVSSRVQYRLWFLKVLLGSLKVEELESLKEEGVGYG
jgi:hypothetical protein